MLTSKVSGTFLVILASICLCYADITAQHQYRQQRQRQQVQQSMPYPAAGYRPGRQFVLPQEQPQQQDEQGASNGLNIGEEEQPARRPHFKYEAPNASPQTARLTEEFQPQQYFFAPQPAQHHKLERITASAAKSSRLAVNSEAAQDDDEDEIASDIEVDKQTDNVPRTAVASPQTSTVYYPAGAVSFVQPLPATAVAAAPIPQPAAATVIAQPASANYLQQLQYANFQVQPAVAAAVAPAVATPSAAAAAAAVPFAFDQPAAAKLTVQPVTAAKLEAQPMSATTFAAAPAPYFASSAFFASPTTAAYTAPFVQSQFFVPAGTASMAQLQAW